MARPRKTLTAEQLAELETLAALLSQDQIADYFGISRPTLAAIMSRDDAVYLRYKKGKSRAIAAIATSLIKAAREGDRAAQIFYLKTQAGWRETSAVELSNPDGTLHPKPPAVDLSRLSDAALAEILAATDAQNDNPPGD